MAFSFSLKCYPWSPTHTIHQTPSPPPASAQKTFTSLSFRLSHRHDQLLTHSSLSYSTPTTTYHHPLPADFTPQQLLDALRRQNDESSVLRLFCWASKQANFTPDSTVYEVLRKLGRVGSFESMRSILDEMKLVGCSISSGTFFIFIQSYAAFDLYDEILGVVEMMEGQFGGIKPDVSTFNILIKALCRAHQIRPALLLMDEMSNQGLHPDEKTFTTLMQGYIEKGDMNEALKMRDQMVAHGCLSTNVTVNVLVNGFCKEGRVEETFSFIEKMLDESFSPDQFTFNTLVKGLCRVGHVTHALEIMDVMLQEGFELDIFTYNSLISGLCKLGEIEEAVELLDQMVSRDCSPNTVTYNTLISILSKENRSKRVEEASHLMDQMIMEGLKPDKFTYNSMLTYFCRSGDIKKAAYIV
ncbi:hypothetical protein FF1_032659 [Malus domestica]